METLHNFILLDILFLNEARIGASRLIISNLTYQMDSDYMTSHYYIDKPFRTLGEDKIALKVLSGIRVDLKRTKEPVLESMGWRLGAKSAFPL